MLWLLFLLATAIHAELCQPDAKNAFKMRLSIKTALEDKAYAWDANEEYLFRAMIAFSMRKFPNRGTTDSGCWEVQDQATAKKPFLLSLIQSDSLCIFPCSSCP